MELFADDGLNVMTSIFFQPQLGLDRIYIYNTNDVNLLFLKNLVIYNDFRRLIFFSRSLISSWWISLNIFKYCAII
ncbi:MAG: hypothetical protein ACK46B_06315 [Bacteroidota bacterium]